MTFASPQAEWPILTPSLTAAQPAKSKPLFDSKERYSEVRCRTCTIAAHSPIRSSSIGLEFAEPVQNRY